MNKRSSYNRRMGYYKCDDCESCGVEIERHGEDVSLAEAEAFLPAVTCACGWLLPAEWVDISEELVDDARSEPWS